MARELVSYKDRIVRDPEIMVGKPVVKGTRIPLERVIQHLADNPEVNDLFQAFPHLTVEDVKACLAYGTTGLNVNLGVSLGQHHAPAGLVNEVPHR